MGRYRLKDSGLSITASVLLALLLARPAQPRLPVILIHTPAAYQVFQRVQGTADIIVSGEVRHVSAPVTITISWRGTTVRIPNVRRTFTAVLPAQRPGQGELVARIVGTHTETAVPYVGVGDVFVIAGQSNASGRGWHWQRYEHETLKAGMLGNDYQWNELADPVDRNDNTVDAVSDDGEGVGGSYWPLLATYILQAEGVPVAFVPTALGGSTIADWQPADKFDRHSLYGALVNRALWTGGIRAVLWHQGENDTRAQLAPALYAERLDTLTAAIERDLGAPLIAARLQALTSAPAAAVTAINRAMPDDSANLADIVPDDYAHIQSDAGLQEAARQWWLALCRSVYARRDC